MQGFVPKSAFMLPDWSTSTTTLGTTRSAITVSSTQPPMSTTGPRSGTGPLSGRGPRSVLSLGTHCPVLEHISLARHWSPAGVQSASHTPSSSQ
ncbi:MAG: hypothetical protein IPG81_10610 [Sandaracinaceae bacterium]|nr:hypothetical protein [Sandaracinaceae bacterium]